MNLNQKKRVCKNWLEWISYFEMIGGVSAVRAEPGRGTGTNRCRNEFCNEIETLAHVLGYCPHRELLRLNRHNKIVNKLANFFKTNEMECP